MVVRKFNYFRFSIFLVILGSIIFGSVYFIKDKKYKESYEFKLLEKGYSQDEIVILLDKYENDAVAGGKIFVDSTLISRKVERTDVDVYYVPASGLANEKNLKTLANMIITGKVISAVPEIGSDNLEAALNKVISARHQDMLAYNLDALKLGAEY